MKMPSLFLASLLFLFSHPSFSADPSISTTVNSGGIEIDSLVTTPSGASFPLPKGWFSSKKGSCVILQDPDKQLTFIYSENKESDGVNAINAAWKDFDAAHVFESTDVKTNRNPEKWEEITKMWYWVPDPQDFRKPDPNRWIDATARRKDGLWFVFLLDGNKAAIDRRNAQLTLITTGLVPRGAQEEKASDFPNVMDEKGVKTFFDFVDQAKSRCKIPGVAVGIVIAGNKVLEKCYGVRQLGKSDPVTPKTLFSVASMTKPLTTLMMARLVDSGRMSWDTPVTTLYPGFQLADPRMLRDLTLKHTVCACAGLPRQDTEMIFQTEETTPESVMEKMRTMSPTTGFGETFQYSNIMVAAGGYVAAHALLPEKPLGTAYDEAMQTLVFDPLGMVDTGFHLGAVQYKEYATPHGDTLESEYETVPFTFNDWLPSVRPAAGAWSNVKDMEKYLMVELSGGLGPDSKRLVSEANLEKRREPLAAMSADSAYGLGLIRENKYGQVVLGHGGNSMGYTTDMLFVPGSGVGLVMMCNADQAEIFRTAVHDRFLEILFDKPQRAKDVMDRAMGRKAEWLEKMNYWFGGPVVGAWVTDFAGDYFNQDVGKISLEMSSEGPVLATAKWKARLVSYYQREGEVRVTIVQPPLLGDDFILNNQEGHITMTFDTPQKKYLFEWAGKNGKR